MVLQLLLLGLGLGLAFLVGEVVVRVAWPQVDAEQWFESNTRYGHTLKANFHQRYRYPKAGVAYDVRTNSLGLRDREYDLGRRDVRRVVLMGDSFTFGEGVDAAETFDEKLEALLARDGRPYEVLNTGVGGWGTIQATRFAKDHFADFRPDVIVYTFCANDPGDDRAFLRGERDNEHGRVPFPFKIFVRNHSHLYRFLFFKYETLRWRREMDRMHRVDPNLVVDPQSGGAISEGDWPGILARIRDFHREFLAYNPRGLLLVQASHPLGEDIRRHLATLSEGSLRFVDLHDEAARLGRRGMRLPYDGHWSGPMHTVSAAALQAAIRRWEQAPPAGGQAGR